MNNFLSYKKTTDTMKMLVVLYLECVLITKTSAEVKAAQVFIT